MIKKAFIIPLFFLFSSLSVSSCSTNNDDNKKEIEVNGVSLTCSKESIYLDETCDLFVSIAPVEATNKKYSYTFTPSNLIEIKNDTVFPLSEGKVEINVITESGNYKDSVSLNILKRENTVTDKEYIKSLYQDEYNHDLYPTSKGWGLSELDNVGVNYDKLNNEELYKVPNKGKIYNAKDYKITFNSENNAGNLTLLLNELANVDGVKIIKFESGTYYMNSTILANNVSNVYLVGNKDTKFIYTGWMGFIKATNCNNLHLNNIIFDINPSPTITGKIVSSEEDDVYAYIYVNPDEEYDLSNEIYQKYYLKRTGSYAEYYYDDEYKSYIPNRNGNLFYNAGSTGLTDLTYDKNTKLLKVTLKKNFPYCSYKKPNKGVVVSVGFQVYESFGFYYLNCVDTYMENITTYTVGGMGLRTDNGKNLYLNRVNFIREIGTGRLLTCTADILHTCNLEGVAKFTNCILEGSHDDAINVKTFYTKITDIDGNVVSVSQTQNEVSISFDVGDEVEIYDPSNMSYKDTYKVMGVKTIGSNYDLTLDKKVPNKGSKNYTGFNLGNASKATRVTLDNSVIKNKRNRGILLQGRDSIISNCTFLNVNMGAIQVLGVDDVFKEAIVPKNIKIYNNKFLKCYDDIQVFTYGSKGPSEASNNTLKDCDIYNNFFYKSIGNTMALYGVGNIKVHNNFDFQLNSKTYTVYVHHADDVTISDNITYFASDVNAFNYVKDGGNNNNLLINNNLIKGVL